LLFLFCAQSITLGLLIIIHTRRDGHRRREADAPHPFPIGALSSSPLVVLLLEHGRSAVRWPCVLLRPRSQACHSRARRRDNPSRFHSRVQSPKAYPHNDGCSLHFCASRPELLVALSAAARAWMAVRDARPSRAADRSFGQAHARALTNTQLSIPEMRLQVVPLHPPHHQLGHHGQGRTRAPRQPTASGKSPTPVDLPTPSPGHHSLSVTSSGSGR
jgi:hypothetical protein